jgi:hypothetical protein
MPPVIVAVGAMAVGALTSGAVAGAVIAGVTITAGMAAVIGGTVAMGVSALGNMALNALMPSTAQLPAYDSSVSAFQNAQGYLLNKQTNHDALPLIYGSRTVGGAIPFMEVTGAANEYLHLIVTLCEGPISAINTVYLDDVAMTDARFAGLVDVYKHLGDDDQLADSALMAATSKWTENHRLRGVAYLYLRLKYDQDAFSRGLPTITADVDGRTVYDPRDDATKFSRNPALCIRDYLTSTRYGRGLDASLIDDTAIIAAANYCDESVTVGGVTQSRYTCDGIVDVDDTPLAIVGKLLTSCRGWLIFTGGLYKLIIDKPETATAFAFSEDNITGSWKIFAGSKKNTFNRLRVNFFNPARSWQADITSVESTALRALDNALILEKTIDLPFTANIDTARQLATIALNQSRQQIVCQFRAFVEGLRCEVGDVVPITHSTPGWTAKEFRIIRMALRNDDEVEVTAIEYDATVYDFGTISAVDATPNTNLPDMTATAAPVNLQASEELYYTATGKGVQVRANLTWQPSPDAFVTAYDVEYKLSTDTEWTFATTTKARAAAIYDLAAARYDFRVRAVNTMGVASSWTVLANVLLAGLTTPPADIEGLFLRPLEGQAHLQWDRAAELDVLHGGYIKVRYANLQSGATWEGGQDIGPALAGSSTNAVLPLMPGTYMVKAVDSTGNYSVNAAAVVTNVPSILAMNYVDSLDEAAGGFTGDKTHLVVDGVTLKLDVEPFEIDQEDGDAILTEVCSVRWRMTTESGDDLTTEDGAELQQEEYEVPYGAGGDTIYNDEWAGSDTVWATGTYLFSSGIDLGGVYVSRVWSDFQFSGYQINDLIDNRSLTADDWQNWDGEAVEYTGATLYVRTTLDDPAGSPTWTGWAPFTIADYKARAYEFKVEAYTRNPNCSVAITALEVTIDMPDRTERGNNVAVADTGLTVAFGKPFKETPAIGVTVNNMAAGDYYALSAQTRTGFTVNIYDSLGGGVARKIDWMAAGYGGEE